MCYQKKTPSHGLNAREVIRYRYATENALAGVQAAQSVCSWASYIGKTKTVNKDFLIDS